MSYCTIENIENLINETILIQLTDDAGVDAVDETLVNAAITAADATIDTYCQKYWPVPLSPVPAKITELSVDIAVYNLYSRCDLALPEIRKERHEAAIRFLEKVAAGSIDLGVSTPSPADTNNSVEFESNTRQFNRSKMRGF
ncbi:MAG: DUF1320 domain-containing protein [Victivallales bacterium]|jgi:phage gp36-like protein